MSGIMLQHVLGQHSLDGAILGGKVVTDIWKPESSEDGISNRMGEDIRIGMSLQALGMGNFHTPENKWPVRGELVDIVTNSNTGHDRWASGGRRVCAAFAAI